MALPSAEAKKRAIERQEQLRKEEAAREAQERLLREEREREAARQEKARRKAARQQELAAQQAAKQQQQAEQAAKERAREAELVRCAQCSHVPFQKDTLVRRSRCLYNRSASHHHEISVMSIQQAEQAQAGRALGVLTDHVSPESLLQAYITGRLSLCTRSKSCLDMSESTRCARCGYCRRVMKRLNCWSDYTC